MAGRGAARPGTEHLGRGSRRRRGRGRPERQPLDDRPAARVLVDTEVAIGDVRVRVQVTDAGGEIVEDGSIDRPAHDDLLETFEPDEHFYG